MISYKLGVVESRFADLIWEHEPLTTSELIQLCTRELSWKRTTTYTVLKKLCERGFFQVQDRCVSSLCSREDYYAAQSQLFVEENYEGSLPAFLAAFTKRNTLTADEISKIRSLIDSAGEV